MGRIFSAGLLLALKGPVGGALITLDLGTLAQRPRDVAIRAGLSALVLLAALILGPRLAHLTGAVPVRVVAALGRDGGAPRATLVEERRGLGTWLACITLASVWIAALAALVLIWLSDEKGVLPNDPQVIFSGLGYIVTRVGISLVVLAASLVFARLLERVLERGLGRRLDQNLLLLTGRVVYIATLIIGVIVILVVWDTGLVIPLAVFGALGVALSLALQDILKNLVSGIYLLIERRFVIGDHISVPTAPTTYTGEVEDIQLRVTVLRTPDGQQALIPNALLFTSPVVNLSAYERRRVNLSVTLPRSAGAEDVNAVAERILAVLGGVPGVRPEPAPEVTLNGVSVGYVELRAGFWVPTGDPRREDAIVSEAIERLRARLPQAQISLGEITVSPA
jgi:small-conductance mechanosensitive channel